MLDGMVASTSEAMYWVKAIFGSLVLIVLPSMSIYMPYRNNLAGCVEITPHNVAGRVVVPAIVVFVVILLIRVDCHVCKFEHMYTRFNVLRCFIDGRSFSD